MNDLGSRIAAAQSTMATPWDSARSNRVFGAAVKARGARARRHRVTMIMGVVASAALFVLAVHVHHVRLSPEAGGSPFARGSDPSSSTPDDPASSQGPLSLNTGGFSDGGSEAD